MDDAIGYFNCNDCVKDLPVGISPREYVNLEIGITKDNVLKIHCVRHEKPLGQFPLQNNVVKEMGITEGSCDCCEL